MVATNTDRRDNAADHYRKQAAVLDAAVADVVDVLAARCGYEADTLLDVEDELAKALRISVDPEALRTLLAAALVRLAAQQRGRTART